MTMFMTYLRENNFRVEFYPNQSFTVCNTENETGHMDRQTDRQTHTLAIG